ncbi:hypothetical protein [Senegalia sp. (in: firmicutes)]|uniref:hypothetical protein n=1 Tax=Senegalia sp. (in: firmicutes) TaxID=1924098 RepID=UPI003F9B426E
MNNFKYYGGIQIEKLKPTEKEKVVLSLFYNRFYDLYEEIVNEDFMNQEARIRFYKLREAFSIYKELLSYEPIKEYISFMKKGGRPYFEGLIADDLFSFIRNLSSHFPIFDKWDDMYINKNLATWDRVGQIDKFLNKSIKAKIDGKGTIKYRLWEEKKKKMTYLSINLPEEYSDKKIYLKDIISEEMGAKFCMALMRSILDVQVENAEKPDIKIMSQVYFPKQ